jgi:Holliday junction resolvase
VSGRRKGLDAEREAVRELRAFGLRALRAERERAAGPERRSAGVDDVDAVVLVKDGPAWEVQIKREENLPLAEYVRRYVGTGRRVLMYRENRSGWRVVVYSTHGGEKFGSVYLAARALTIAQFAHFITRECPF